LEEAAGPALYCPADSPAPALEGAMLPGVMVDFLGRASVAMAGTRDRDLVPHLHVVTGWAVEDDRETVRCLVPAMSTAHLVGSLEDNGRFALTAEVIGPHETYQFKGRCLDTRPVDAADRPIWEACRERFVRDVLRQYRDGFSADDLRARCPEPVIAVRFRVEEIFVQTPGPAAGHRLYPAE
jgi:hypothetical protein